MQIQIASLLNQRYLILASLGEGGFADVYKAEDQKLNRLVAIKVLKNVLHNEDDLKRFQREAKILAHLVHQNLLSIYSVEVSDGANPFLVMEYVEGVPLSKYLSTAAEISVIEALDIFQQLCRGLSYAHQAGVVHRDLSPQNIIICGELSSPRVKIIDFGLSKLLGESDKLTKTGSLLGNPAYMSPEVATGAGIDKRADIYSLACIFYEMLGGKRPFDADNAVAYIYKRKNEFPVRPEFKCSDSGLKNKIESILLICLQKDPNHRFQNCDDIIAMIEQPGMDAAVKTLLQELPDSWAESVKKNNKTFKNFAISALCLIGIVCGALLLNAKPDRKLEKTHTAPQTLAERYDSDNRRYIQLNQLIQAGKIDEAEALDLQLRKSQSFNDIAKFRCGVLSNYLLLAMKAKNEPQIKLRLSGLLDHMRTVPSNEIGEIAHLPEVDVLNELVVARPKVLQKIDDGLRGCCHLEVAILHATAGHQARQANPAKALQEYKISQNFFDRSTVHYQGRMMVYCGMAIAYAQLKEFAKAHAELKKSELYFRAGEDGKDFPVKIACCRALLWRMEGRLDDAGRELAAAVVKLDQKQFPLTYLELVSEICIVDLGKGKYAEALKLIDEVQPLMQKQPDSPQSQLLLRLQSEIKKQLGGRK